MLDSMQEGFLVINEKGILQEVNTELCNILRRPSSDLVGKAIVHFMAKESKMAFLQRVDDWKDKYSFIFQANFIRPNGSTVICMIKGTPLREEDGKVTGGFAMISDITDQITTYMDLQESEKKWRLLYDNMPGGSFVVNEDHEIEDVNEVVLKITGFSKDELLGNDCSLICGHDLSSCPIFTDNSKNINNIETFIGTKSKKLIPIIKSTRKITLENRVLIIENFQDLTKLKEVEQNLQEKEAQLLHSQKMEAVGVLVGGVAHDFNNLLTVINGYSDMILEEASSTDPFREEMEEIRNAGKRAKSLTAQLLAFSRKQVLKLQTIDLNSVILNVQKMLFRLIGEDIQLKTTLTKAF